MKSSLMTDTAVAATALAADSHGHDDHHAHPDYLAHHFDTPKQQFDAAKIGMWSFLVQEILFFSGVFVAYGVFRSWYPETFSAASQQLNPIMGGTNTVVLLFSSLTAALAVRSSALGRQKETTRWIVLTILCACIFLVVKYFEYAHKFEAGLLPGKYFHPHASHLVPGSAALPANSHVFFSIYFMATGIHGIHVLVGIGVFSWILKRNLRNDFKQYNAGVDMTALYWHLVDLVWIYLFPLMYLID